jgi:hypothetical protein
MKLYMVKYEILTDADCTCADIFLKMTFLRMEPCFRSPAPLKYIEEFLKQCNGLFIVITYTPIQKIIHFLYLTRNCCKKCNTRSSGRNGTCEPAALRFLPEDLMLHFSQPFLIRYKRCISIYLTKWSAEKIFQVHHILYITTTCLHRCLVAFVLWECLLTWYPQSGQCPQYHLPKACLPW